MRSNSSQVNEFNKQQQVIHVTAAERTWGRDEGSGNYTERGTCGTVHNTRNLTRNVGPFR